MRVLQRRHPVFSPAMMAHTLSQAAISPTLWPMLCWSVEREFTTGLSWCMCLCYYYIGGGDINLLVMLLAYVRRIRRESRIMAVSYDEPATEAAEDKHVGLVGAPVCLFICLYVCMKKIHNGIMPDLLQQWKKKKLKTVELRDKYFVFSNVFTGLYDWLLVQCLSSLSCFITCHVIVFMPLTDTRSPRAVHKMPYCPLSGACTRQYTTAIDLWTRSCMWMYMKNDSSLVHFLCACTCTCAGQPSCEM